MKAVCFRPGLLPGARGAGKGVPGRGAATICAAAFTGALTRSRCPGGGRSPVSGGGHSRSCPPYLRAAWEGPVTPSRAFQNMPHGEGGMKNGQ